MFLKSIKILFFSKELSSWIATGQVLDCTTATGQVWTCLDSDSLSIFAPYRSKTWELSWKVGIWTCPVAVQESRTCPVAIQEDKSFLKRCSFCFVHGKVDLAFFSKHCLHGGFITMLLVDGQWTRGRCGDAAAMHFPSFLHYKINVTLKNLYGFCFRN